MDVAQVVIAPSERARLAAEYGKPVHALGPGDTIQVEHAFADALLVWVNSDPVPHIIPDFNVADSPPARVDDRGAGDAPLPVPAARSAGARAP